VLGPFKEGGGNFANYLISTFENLIEKIAKNVPCLAWKMLYTRKLEFVKEKVPQVNFVVGN
jgi:hypothetical protein